ncbi:MAG TPA: helix-turn-helix domain-containing protein [Candidatus Saccharimonadales bacterium]|nr:helix-turn-helix domain-containing protein [Candidatus Saccharimonadales bacterium]
MKESEKAKSRVVPAPSNGARSGFARLSSRKNSKARGNTPQSLRVNNADKAANAKPIAATAKASVTPERQLLKTRHQMAARYQVSVRTIGYWCNDGTLPFYKHGGVVRFHPQECDDALKAFRRKSRWETSGDGEENIDNA